MTRGSVRLAAPATFALFALLASASHTTAQSRCEPDTRSITSSGKYSSEPLGRSVTVRSTKVSLREALDRLAAAARVRVSYSAELLPLERGVCIAYESVAIGDALDNLLQGTALEVVAAAADHIVLTPARVRPATVQKEEPAPPVITLEPVVAAASAAREPGKVPSYALDVIDGSKLGDQSSLTLAQALNGVVPGLYSWAQSPSSVLAQYGSIRGASSFGLSYPKVYIDGIEVANPLLITRISADAIDRIEVIRGPQGAALYGSDAISGVTNIITRHESAGTGARTQIRSGFGVSASDFVSGSALAQDHTISLRTGTPARSGGLNLTLGSAGEYMPDAYARHLAADGSLRMVGARTLVTGTLRFFAQHAGTPQSPVLSAIAPQSPLTGANISSDPLSVRQYTAGIRATVSQNARWMHSLVAGIDGYALDGVPDDLSPVLSVADSALRAAGSSALRGTLRLSSTARFQLGEDGVGGLTFSVERSVLRQRATTERPTSMDETHGNSGFSTQLDALLRDRFSLTAGVRFDRNDAADQPARIAALPMIGGSWLASDGPVTVKLRTAYGKSIRWPDVSSQTGSMQLSRLHGALFALDPEEQAGREVGIDLKYRNQLDLQITRFDQTASGLIHRVAIVEPEQRHRAARVIYQLQNVGEIENRGWEMQATVEQGHLTLGGTLSLVNSQVQALARGYTGDLRVGDRPLGVPARTLGLSASWTDTNWSTSLAAYRANDWINYDRLSLTEAAAADQEAGDLVGTNLRTYWLRYSGFTHLRASATRALGPGLSITLSGENLLDYQVGEPDNTTVLPGRTISLALRALF